MAGTPGGNVSTFDSGAYVGVVQPSGDTTGAKDTAAIQAAINAAGTAGGGVVWLTGATYYVTNLTMQAKVSLFGMGPSTLIQVVAGTTGNVFSLAGINTDLTYLRDFRVDASNQTSGDTIHYVNNGGTFTYSTPQHRLMNITIYSAASAGVYLDNGAKETRAFNVFVISPRAGHGFGISCTDSQFEMCTASGTANGYHGFQLNNGANRLVNCKAFYCGDNVAQTSDGFNLTAGYNQLVGCHGQDNGRFGAFVADAAVHTVATGIQLSGNGKADLWLTYSTTLTEVVITGLDCYYISASRYQPANNIVISGHPPNSVITGAASGASSALVSGSLGSNSRMDIATPSGRISTNITTTRGGIQTGSGYYVFCNGQQATGTVAATTNTLYLSAWVVPNEITVQRIGLEVTSAGDVGSTVDPVIYADNGSGYPGTLVLDANTNGGTIPGNTVAVAEVTLTSSVTLAPGLYWVGCVVQNVTTTSPGIRTGVGDYAVPITTSSIPSSNLTLNGYSQASVTGAPPATFTTALGAFGATHAPRIFVKVA